MSTIYCTATSLDGFIADDDASLSWLFRTPDADAEPVGSDDPIRLNFDTFSAGVGALVSCVSVRVALSGFDQTTLVGSS